MLKKEKNNFMRNEMTRISMSRRCQYMPPFGLSPWMWEATKDHFDAYTEKEDAFEGLIRSIIHIGTGLCAVIQYNWTPNAVFEGCRPRVKTHQVLMYVCMYYSFIFHLV